MADKNTYNYMYTPEDVPSPDNEYKIGDPAGPFPYAPPGAIRYGTYPEPPEGYNQYQYQEGNKIIREDLGTGRYPNVGPGMIPKGYEVPAPPPLRTPERRISAPTPTPPSMQSAGYNRDYDRTYMHLDPRMAGTGLATQQEKAIGGTYTGATQASITEQFLKREALKPRTQGWKAGKEQYDTLESYAIDKFNPIPKMGLIEFQDMMENDFKVHDPLTAFRETSLNPSIEAMTEEYDATLEPQYGSSGDPYNLTEARQAANLEATGDSMYTPGVYGNLPTQPSGIQPIPSSNPNEPVASIQPVTSPQPVSDTSRPFESKFSKEDMENASIEMANRKRHVNTMADVDIPPRYSPKTQEIADYLKTNLKTLSEGGSINPADSNAGTNSLAGTLAGVVSGLANLGTKGGLVGAAISIFDMQPEDFTKGLNALDELSKQDFVASDGPSVGTVGLSVDPSDAYSGTGNVQGDTNGAKDGGEVRKYQNGTASVGSINPRISPSQGSSSPAMDFVNEPGAAPPSELADDVSLQAREGDVVFPPESVEVMGLLNMNDMMKAALGLALEVGAVVPADIDPNEKVPVKLTNGEVVVPKVVADALGKERVQEIINKGLKLRAQREEQAKAQQQAPQAAPQAPQAMPQGLKDGSSSIGKQMDSLLQGAESIYKDIKKNPSKWGTAALTEIGDALGLSQDSDLDTRAREAWSSYHGAEPDLLKEAQFVLHQTGKDDPELRKVIQDTLKNYYTEKDGQIIGDKGLNPATVKEIMLRIAAHETPGGETRQMIKEKGKLVPKGRARGRLQVEPTTARSMLTEAKGLIGPKVQSSLEQTFGVPYNEIQTLSDKEFNNVLQNNPRASVEFGILNLITKLKRDKKLDLIR